MPSRRSGTLALARHRCKCAGRSKFGVDPFYFSPHRFHLPNGLESRSLHMQNPHGGGLEWRQSLVILKALHRPRPAKPPCLIHCVVRCSMGWTVSCRAAVAVPFLIPRSDPASQGISLDPALLRYCCLSHHDYRRQDTVACWRRWPWRLCFRNAADTSPSTWTPLLP